VRKTAHRVFDMLTRSAGQAEIDQFIDIRRRQSNDGISSTVVNLHRTVVFQNGAGGEDDIGTEAIDGFIFGFGRQQGIAVYADHLGGILQIQQHHTGAVTLFPGILPAVLAALGIDIHAMGKYQPTLPS